MTNVKPKWLYGRIVAAIVLLGLAVFGLLVCISAGEPVGKMVYLHVISMYESGL